MDVQHVLDPQAEKFSEALRTSKLFGSDHRAVYSTIGGEADGDMPPPLMMLTVLIAAMLPNPEGEDQGEETITLRHARDDAAVLDGWYFLNKAGRRFDVPSDTEIASGAEATLKMAAFEMPLNKNGDEARLFDAEGRPVHSVKYSAAQATPGASVTFAP